MFARGTSAESERMAIFRAAWAAAIAADAAAGRDRSSLEELMPVILKAMPANDAAVIGRAVETSKQAQVFSFASAGA
ncbi:MAG: hypothetical protein AW10_01280 [Candidatus Accumulibacter appositus]|uniref:Uncharacterized protein n=1 Tax=Candidatus Accumulibacter appositus TaxID=1454003 RepID=A0A011P0V4_9PROT|nr:MAG: hypothetical protein AW10_01280 [Candidatus Accumulibacter appositus]